MDILLSNQASVELGDDNDKLAADLAAECGHLATVERLISAAEKAVKGGNGNRLLRTAPGAGQLLVVEYLLQKNTVSPDGDEVQKLRPLCLAASKGYIEVIRTLLRYNANANIEDASRQTPLHHAARNSRYLVASTLLMHEPTKGRRANPNTPDIERHTPLHIAAREGDGAIVDLLLCNGASCMALSRTKETPLHLAIKYPRVVETLLSAGAESSAADMLGQTPLHLATNEGYHDAAKLLLERGADIDAPDYKGNVPLYNAIAKSKLGTVETFLKLCSQIQESQEKMEKVLTWAVESSAYDVLEFLCNNSLSLLRVTNYFKSLAIYQAAVLESSKTLSLLLQHGADACAKNMDTGKTSLHNAAEGGFEENIRLLLTYDVKIDTVDSDGSTPLHIAAGNGNLGAAAILIEKGADVNKQNNVMETPLYMAAYCGHVELVEKLLASGANVHLRTVGGWSALHAACSNLKMSEPPVAKGADINLAGYYGWTPFLIAIAVKENDAEIIRFLSKNGADPNAVNNDGNTALHLALGGGSHEVVEIVLALHPDLAKQNAEGLSPFHMAVQMGEVDLVHLLFSKGVNHKATTKYGFSCLCLATGGDHRETMEFLLNIEASSTAGFDWTVDDVVAAYWAAIKHRAKDCIDLLVAKNRTLLDRVTDDEFTGIEVCLRDRGNHCEEEPLAVRLVELGADPFNRRNTMRKSGLELGIISRRRQKKEFLRACLKSVPKDPLAAETDLGFKELRIALELDWEKNQPNLWKALKGLRESASTVVDNDGWNLGHFIHQATSRIPVHPQGTPPTTASIKTPTRLIIPDMWILPNVDMKARVQVAPDGLKASFQSK